MTVSFSDAERPQMALLSDSELIRRFVSRGSQEAFATLVQRHGQTVFGVCKRLLHHNQDTEDAFQAAFVVLARKAGTINKHDCLASWLYKVAYRIALRLQLDKARRQTQERDVLAFDVSKSQCHGAEEGGLSVVVRRELQQVLDEEVHQLPEKYRAPILLCYLQGQTNEEAAALLRCPTGTVKIRLLRGREILRKRLVKRGLALSLTAWIGEALADIANAAAPQSLVDAAVRAASGSATPAVASLASSALKMMCLVKLKVAALVLVTLGLTCWTNGLMSQASASAATHQLEQRRTPSDWMPTDAREALIASCDR